MAKNYLYDCFLRFLTVSVFSTWVFLIIQTDSTPVKQKASDPIIKCEYKTKGGLMHASENFNILPPHFTAAGGKHVTALFVW